MNADAQSEKDRLSALFPKEKDIYKCKRGDKVCYVKGRLQPTRSFGDMTLKYAEFNNPQKKARNQGFRTKIPVFTGPYVSALPVVKVFDNNSKSGNVGLILGTDGLWDELGKQKVLEIVLGNSRKPLEALLDKSLESAAESANISLSVLKKIPKGKGTRRKYHDDISMVFVDLK